MSYAKLKNVHTSYMHLFYLGLGVYLNLFFNFDYQTLRFFHLEIVCVHILDYLNYLIIINQHFFILIILHKVNVTMKYYT